MGIEWLIVVLIAFMLVAGLIAVEARDLLSSVIAIGAAGFALSVIDLLVGAPDLAITQVVVEVIALVLLIRMVLTRRDTSAVTSRDVLRTGAMLLAAGLILAGAYLAFRPDGPGTVPPFGRPVLANDAEKDAVPPGVSVDYLARAKDETGAVNAVTAVLLDYRAYDTLGEATVIFVSILGAYAILRRVGRRPAEADSPGDEEAT
jgi:multisubunit Na+/H+ antiporter MnhB subunit